jgi:hypothetical protein
MTRIAATSSAIASASKTARTAGETRLPSNASAPTANAMSVAVGIAQPARVAEDAFSSR